MLWKVGADRKCSKVGVSGSAMEDYRRENNPNLLFLGTDLNVFAVS